MIANKHITKIVAVIMAIAVGLCLCIVFYAQNGALDLGESGITMEYETKLFDTANPISVNIIMDEDKWQDMLENAIACGLCWYTCGRSARWMAICSGI